MPHFESLISPESHVRQGFAGISKGESLIAGLCCAKWSSGCRGKPSLFIAACEARQAHSTRCLFLFNDVRSSRAGRDRYYAVGCRIDPIGERCQHLLKIGSLRKPVVSAWKNFQAFRAREGVEQSLALVERHKFIVIALDDQGWNGEASRGLIGDPVEAILIEGIIEWNSGRATVKVWDRIGLFPLLQSFFSKLKTKFLREVDHGTLECQAGEGRDGRRIRNVCCCPVGSSERAR